MTARKTWLVQARPITTHGSAAPADTDQSPVLARGLPAAPGVASGAVRVLLTPDQGDRLRDGEILVAPMTNPDWLPTIRRAAALITDTGGMTCHAAIVAREVGVPCIVGARSATSDLVNGTTVTVDGTHGKVHAGRSAAATQASVVGRPVAAAGDGSLALSTTLHTSFTDAVERTREALWRQGFGVLTELDMRATLKAKLHEDLEDYVILGACNPALALRAVNADRQIGLLLPCNVVVRADPTEDTAVIVEALNPRIMVDVTNEPQLREVADDVAVKLQAAIDSLTES